MLFIIIRFLYHVLRAYLWIAFLFINPFISLIFGKHVMNALQDTMTLFALFGWSVVLIFFGLNVIGIISTETIRDINGKELYDKEIMFFVVFILMPLLFFFLCKRVKVSKNGNSYFNYNALFKIDYNYDIKNDFRIN